MTVTTNPPSFQLDRNGELVIQKPASEHGDWAVIYHPPPRGSHGSIVTSWMRPDMPVEGGLFAIRDWWASRVPGRPRVAGRPHVYASRSCAGGASRRGRLRSASGRVACSQLRVRLVAYAPCRTESHQARVAA